MAKFEPRFNVRIVFTGICAVVPDVPFIGDDTPSEVLVVMPDGWSDTLKYGDAQDGSDLMRHRPFVKFRLSNLDLPAVLPANLPSPIEAVCSLYKSYVTFDYKGGNNPFNIKDLKYLLRMKDAAGEKYSMIDPEALNNPPTEEAKVATQVFFDEGAISAENAYGPWVFPNTLSGAKKHVCNIATDLVVEYRSVTEFSLVAAPFDESAALVLPLKAGDNETVEVTMANLCDQNPLRWYTEYGSLPPDEDFKWYFELLTKDVKEDLKDDLQGLPLPIPYFKDKTNGQGANCFIVEMTRPSTGLRSKSE